MPFPAGMPSSGAQHPPHGRAQPRCQRGSVRGSRCPRRDRTDPNPNPTPGGPPFLHKELSAESVLAVGRAAPACLCKIPPAFTGKYPLWDPCPIGNSTGACCPPATVHNTVLGNNQEEQKNIIKLFVGQEENGKKKVCVFRAKRKMKTKTFCSK